MGGKKGLMISICAIYNQKQITGIMSIGMYRATYASFISADVHFFCHSVFAYSVNKITLL